MNPQAGTLLRSLHEPTSVLPTGSKTLNILYDAVPTEGGIKELQKRLVATAARVLSACPSPRLASMTLATDLYAAVPVHVPLPAGAGLSRGARELRKKLLDHSELASEAELDELDMRSASSCPLLQWQWLTHAARKLRPPQGIESLEMDVCPRPTAVPNSRTYRQLIDSVYASLVRMNSVDNEAVARNMAHHLVAQQLQVADTLKHVQLPFEQRGSPAAADWPALRKTTAPPLVGEGIARLLATMCSHVSRGESGRITVLASDREDALVVTLAALLVRFKDDPAPLATGRCYFLASDTSFVDIGTLYNAAWRRFGSAAGLARFLVAAKLTAVQGQVLLDALVTAEAAAAGPDEAPDFLHGPGVLAEEAQRWYIGAYIKTVEPGATDPVRVYQLWQKRGLGELPRFKDIGLLAGAMRHDLFAASKHDVDKRHYGPVELLKGDPLMSLLEKGGARRFYFDLRKAPHFTCHAAPCPPTH
jgi:hypothetical protein